MMVQDLIDELQGYPPELEVLFLDSELGAVPVTETTVTDEAFSCIDVSLLHTQEGNLS